MAAKRRRKSVTVKRHKRGGTWVHGYCRRRPTSRGERAYRQAKQWGF